MASVLLEAEGVDLEVFTDLPSAMAWLAPPATAPVTGKVVSINRSNGGVPKRPVAECRVSDTGLADDRQRDLHFHGGPNRAVCLYSLERIEALRSEGHPIAPGRIGENLGWSRICARVMRAGVVRVGDTIRLPDRLRRA